MTEMLGMMTSPLPPCKLCGNTYHDAEWLTKHMKLQHPYKCNQCPMRFTLTKRLEEHQDEVHSQSEVLMMMMPMWGEAGGQGDPIMEGVHRAQLPLKMDTRTPGDGNCGPRATVQQCQRRAVGLNTVRDHMQLRKETCNFMRESEVQVVQNLKRLWEESEGSGDHGEPWDAFWQRMSGDKEWVEGMFLQGMALYLERDIHIVLDCATPERPWMDPISGNRAGSGTACHGGFIILGYQRNVHYQSLLPLDEESFTHGPFQPRGLDEIVEGERIPGGHESVRTTRKQGGGHEFFCLLCNTIQKQIPSHMKKAHAKKFSPEALKTFQDNWRKYSQSLRQAKRRTKRKTDDHEALKKDLRQQKAKERTKRKADDHEALKTDQRDHVAKHRTKRKADDHEALKKDQRVQKAKYRKRNTKEKAFKEETKTSCVFPCVCCHSRLFRENVVQFNENVKENIRKKAEAAHSKAQVIIFYLY